MATTPNFIEQAKQHLDRVGDELAEVEKKLSTASQDADRWTADQAQKLGAFCRYNTSLPKRLSELAILITAKNWRAQYEWYAHEPMARDGGLGDDVIAAIKAGTRPAFAAADEEAVYNLGMELYETQRVSDATFAAAKAQLGEAGVVELVGIMGYYALVSLTLNAFQVPLP